MFDTQRILIKGKDIPDDWIENHSAQMILNKDFSIVNSFLSKKVYQHSMGFYIEVMLNNQNFPQSIHLNFSTIKLRRQINYPTLTACEAISCYSLLESVTGLPIFKKGIIKRLDIPVDIVLNEAPSKYSPLFNWHRSLKKKRYKNTIYFLSGKHEICIYDKSLESRLENSNVMRIEHRFSMNAKDEIHPCDLTPDFIFDMLGNCETKLAEIDFVQIPIINNDYLETVSVKQAKEYIVSWVLNSSEVNLFEWIELLNTVRTKKNKQFKYRLNSWIRELTSNRVANCEHPLVSELRHKHKRVLKNIIIQISEIHTHPD